MPGVYHHYGLFFTSELGEKLLSFIKQNLPIHVKQIASLDIIETLPSEPYIKILGVTSDKIVDFIFMTSVLIIFYFNLMYFFNIFYTKNIDYNLENLGFTFLFPLGFAFLFLIGGLCLVSALGDLSKEQINLVHVWHFFKDDEQSKVLVKKRQLRFWFHVLFRSLVGMIFILITGEAILVLFLASIGFKP